MNNWACLDVEYQWWKDPFRVRVTTDVKCRLTLYLTFTQPRKHRRTRFLRGLAVPWGVYFCFVSYIGYEQIENYEERWHTFEIPDWPVSATGWFIIAGTIGGVISPSASPIFKYRRPAFMTFIGRHTDGYLYYYPGTYEEVHDSPVANYIQDGDLRSYYVGQSGAPARTVVHRMAFFFDTSPIEHSFTICAGRFATMAIRVGDTEFDLVLVPGWRLNEPLQFIDFGTLLLETQSCGETPALNWIHWHIIDLNPYGLTTIRPQAITAFGMRSSCDIDYQPPTDVETCIIRSSYSEVPPYLQLAYYP